ncbi:hypothetical protein J6590_041501 [Homalodisca vitripennis]|nr:hypothetical protein J6590_041501 [Homalodisca vitripennis]
MAVSILHLYLSEAVPLYMITAATQCPGQLYSISLDLLSRNTGCNVNPSHAMLSPVIRSAAVCSVVCLTFFEVLRRVDVLSISRGADEVMSARESVSLSVCPPPALAVSSQLQHLLPAVIIVWKISDPMVCFSTPFLPAQ